MKLNRKRCFYTYQALLNDLKKLKMYPESNSLDKQTKYLSKEVKVKQKKMFLHIPGTFSNDLKKLKMYPESNSLDQQTKYLSKEVKVKQKKMFSYKLGLLRRLKH